jgi:hypothetical protein
VTQEPLFYETLNDALKAIVRALKGAKAVGVKLWPEKTPDGASRLLNDCLNEDRAEKLSPEQVMWLLTEGRRVGCHAAMNFLAAQAGYADPQPIEPEDERVKLQREFIEAQKYMAKLAGRMERVGMLGAD